MTEDTAFSFSISGDAYLQVTAWQSSVDQDILRYQLEKRGHATVYDPDSETRMRRITELTDLGQAGPYYGAYGGAYRYTFHPTENSCELEVFNQMGGFAYFYPKRIDPLIMRLPYTSAAFIPPGGPGTAPLVSIQPTVYEGGRKLGAMYFRIPPRLARKLQDWPWFGRPLSAYDFIFIPGASGCTIRVRMREADANLWLIREDSF